MLTALFFCFSCKNDDNSSNEGDSCIEKEDFPPIILWELARGKGDIANSVAPLSDLDQKCADSTDKPSSLGMLGDSPQHKIFLVFSGYHPYSLPIPNKEKRKLAGPDGSIVIANSYPDFFLAATADKALVHSLTEAGFDSRLWFGGSYNTDLDNNLPQEHSIYHCSNWTQASDSHFGTALTQTAKYGYHGGLYDVRDCLPNSIDYILACLSY